MPQVSCRQRALRGLKRAIRAVALSEIIDLFFDLFDDDDEDVSSLDVPDPGEDMLMECNEAYWMISRSRYLNKRQSVPRAPDSMDFWLSQLDEKRFTQDFRVTRFQFKQIADLIQDHPVLSTILTFLRRLHGVSSWWPSICLVVTATVHLLES
ncbi:hypothetical protein PR001_g23474 [Phytophthora rubi]|uniref:Uncharacterized protein n=1 Tax=Phytophthora rubi TaxID=129364 RepID=A0A6A3IV24_9STRA|nr:hypothetical protein PR001_g23474 [Phytophthora rubi]